MTSRQTVLPILLPETREVAGYIPIPETEFQGGESTYMAPLTSGELTPISLVAITKYTPESQKNFVMVGVLKQGEFSRSSGTITLSLQNYVSVADARNRPFWSTPGNVVHQDGELSEMKAIAGGFTYGTKFTAPAIPQDSTPAGPSSGSVAWPAEIQVNIPFLENSLAAGSVFQEVRWADLVRPYFEELSATPVYVESLSIQPEALQPNFRVFLTNQILSLSPSEPYSLSALPDVMRVIRVTPLTEIVIPGNLEVHVLVNTNLGSILVRVVFNFSNETAL